MNGKVQGAQSFARTMAVLQRIADASTPPDLADLLADAGLTRPTLYRILASLEAEGLVERRADRRYRLGARLIGLAHRALAQQDIRATARESLLALRDQTGETVHLAVRGDDGMVYIDKMESEQTVRMASAVGTRVAMHSTSVGRAWLSALPAAERQAAIDELTLTAFTPNTITSASRLATLTDDGASRGFCTENEENELGIVCFGAPILDETGRPVAAVSVSVPTFRLASDQAVYADALVRCCTRVSTLNGWRGN